MPVCPICSRYYCNHTGTEKKKALKEILKTAKRLLEEAEETKPK